MDVVSQLLSTLVVNLADPRQLVSNQANQTPAPAIAPQAVKPILDESIQGFTPANANNLSTVRRPASVIEEPAVFMMRVEVEALLRCKKKSLFSGYLLEP